MGEMKEFSLAIQMFLKVYQWRKIDPVPWTPLRQPLNRCRLALISSAGFVPPNQPPFDDSVKGGDSSFREIPDSIDLAELSEFHRSQSFDHQGIHQDPNLALPIQRVHELAGTGRIGSVNHRHLSFMGSITAPARLVRDSAPKAAQLLVEDGVDVALLVPV